MTPGRVCLVIARVRNGCFYIVTRQTCVIWNCLNFDRNATWKMLVHLTQIICVNELAISWFLTVNSWVLYLSDLARIMFKYFDNLRGIIEQIFLNYSRPFYASTIIFSMFVKHTLLSDQLMLISCDIIKLKTIFNISSRNFHCTKT